MARILQHRSDQDPQFQETLLNTGYSRLLHTTLNTYWGTNTREIVPDFIGSNTFGILKSANKTEN